MNTELLFNDVNFDPGLTNFDPDQIQGSETINAVFVIDVSPSVQPYENELNEGFNGFISEMQGSHIADELFVSTIEFCEKIVSKKGFQPVTSVVKSDFRGQGRGTALYDAVDVGLSNALDYRNSQLQSGITCKTLLFVITDGQDNSSQPNSASNVKKKHENIMMDEANAFSFTSILFGINSGCAVDFENAKNEMGIQFLANVGMTAKEIRKMISWISSSVSSSASGQAIQAPNF